MIRDHFPPEIKFHKKRFSEFSLNWLEDQFAKFVGNIEVSDTTQSQKSYQYLADFYLSLLESDLPVDAEIAYVAVKLGVITGKLSKVLNINWSNKAPSILLYQGLANIFMNNFGEAEKLLIEAENKASKENDDAVLLEIWGIQIYLENAKYAYYKGLKIYDKALAHYNSIGDEEAKDNLSGFFQWVRIAGAKSLLKTGNVRECLYLNQGALNDANKINDKFFRAFSLLGLGHALDLVGQVKESVRLYTKGLKLAQKINSNNLVSIIYNRLGMASAWRLNNLDDGTEYFKRAILFSNKGESHWLKDGPMWNLAAAYQSKKDFTKAINTIQEIAFNARQAGESRTELIATLNLAQLLEEVGNYDEARKTRDAGESLASILGISLNDSYPDNYSSFDEESDSEEDYYTDFESEIDDDNYEDEEELDLSEDDYYPSTLEFKIDLGPEDEDSENIPDEE
ncbi:MAG: hypothetical protein ACW98A_15305 [Candidatus Hodarchaeales archaeon]|jgi:tetratricopeptide (TPR) repeat protein